MDPNRLDQFPPRRRRSVVPVAVWPWQRTMVPERPRQPQRQHAFGCAADVEEENCRSIAANGSPGNKEAESESLEDAVAEGDGGLTSTSRELETSRGSQMATPERAVSPASSADDGWSCISVKEKRRLWLKRRRMGEFYFRSEFKGLVHTVMMSRGWMPACPPRVSDEELTNPYVEAWEENGDRIVPAATSPLERETAMLCLEAYPKPAREDCTATPLSSEPPPSTMPEPGQRHDEKGSEAPGRGRQWDIHWSYTKWAVETMRFARKLMPWQRVNHFRNSNELCRKDLMLKNLKKRRAQLTSQGDLTEASAYDFFPTSFAMPKDYALFAEAFKETGGTWIMKPSGAAEGRGIFLISKLSEVKAWSKPQAFRRLSRHDPAHPGSYIIQRYVSNPYVIGGKKFDLRLYVLVTSFRPLTVYIYRDGFAKFSSTRFSADPRHLRNELMHLTNHAVQRRGSASGKKWTLKKLKLFVAAKHGQKAMDRMFWEINVLMIRTLRAVDRLIISDKQSFELFGYDIIVDSTLRPWLLEVNASPSLGASSRGDSRLKKQMVGDVFDIIDVEGRMTPGTPIRKHVGGFDLVYRKGYVEVQPHWCGHSNLLGAVVKNSVKQTCRTREDKDKFASFLRPRAASLPGRSQTPAVVVQPDADAEHNIGPSSEWLPNILTFRPEDHWLGMAEYIPWKAEDSVIHGGLRETECEKNAGMVVGGEDGHIEHLYHPAEVLRMAKGGEEPGFFQAGRDAKCTRTDAVAGMDGSKRHSLHRHEVVSRKACNAVDVREGEDSSQDERRKCRDMDGFSLSLKPPKVMTVLLNVLDTLRRARKARGDLPYSTSTCSTPLSRRPMP